MTKAHKRPGPGRPGNPKITSVSENLGVSRQRAGQIIREYSSAHPRFASELSQARLEAIRERIRVNRAQAEKLEHENLLLTGKYCSREEMREQGKAIGAVLVSVFSAWDKDLAAEVCGRSELESQRIISSHVDRLFHDLRARWEVLALGK